MSEENEDLGQEVEIDAPEASEPETAQAGDPPREEDSGESKETELENYSKNVQTRIKKLTEKYRKEERDRQEAVRVAQQLLEENQKLKGRVTQLDSGYLDQYGARAEAQVASARQAYRDAYEAGDADKVVAAQEALSRAVADQDRYNLAKSRAERQQQDSQRLQQQPRGQDPYQSYQPQQVQPAPVDPKAQGWAEKNTWFGQDEVMTYAAFGIHRKLVEDEGFDPQSEEYYSEVDRRMRAEFPQKFKAERKTGGAQVASASSSASRSTKQGRRSVKLSPSQIAIARKLNVPLEEYAKYVKE
jgi:hypothetical protein